MVISWLFYKVWQVHFSRIFLNYIKVAFVHVWLLNSLSKPKVALLPLLETERGKGTIATNNRQAKLKSGTQRTLLVRYIASIHALQFWVISIQSNAYTLNKCNWIVRKTIDNHPIMHKVQKLAELICTAAKL